ncbi:MAG: 23S rRNA (guanosine(2251)-2'-O)-methyltransferase RlmB [Cyclobacteriaceae bacterium]|nr:23S rRNA (guanosine(2251)-2'-O)-methyltransferase RlmB [Cyclobacteriaceae bacterium]
MEKRKKEHIDTDMIFGIRPVVEAIRSGKVFDKLFVQKNLMGDLLKELMQEIKDHRVIYTKVPIEKLNRLTRKNHQGVVGFISPIEFASIENIIDRCFSTGKNPLIIVLDRITDVRNFGAIVRTAECAGVDAVVVPARGAAQISSDAMKTSAGALNHVPICRAFDLKQTLENIQQSGINLVACTEKTNTSVFSADLTLPAAVIMGSEEDGISDEIMKLADQKARIPILGRIESLNVSTSTGIIIYEALRQRME